MSDLSQDLEQLVAAGRSASRPTQADFDRVLGSLQGRLAASAAGGALTAAAGAGRGLRLLSGKTIAIAAAGFALIVGGFALWSSNHLVEPDAATPEQPTRTGSAAPAMHVVRPDASNATSDNTATVQAAENPGAGPNQGRPTAPSGSVREPFGRVRDNLSDEVAILSRAETELHSGRAESALRFLNEHERKFPNGVLAEERTAARIQALCALGRSAEANTLLARLRPGSLHGESSRQACAARATVRQAPTSGQPSASVSSNKH
jgi:hypothetical protein